MNIPLEMLLVHAVGGLCGGVVALLLVPPDAEPDAALTRPVLRACARLAVSVISAELFAGVAVQVLMRWGDILFKEAEPTFYVQFGVAGVIGLASWWVINAALLFMRRRRHRDIVDWARDLKRSDQDAEPR
jgi:hypothetical protein